METQAVTSMSLPPLQNLPQWPRIQTLDKARYPRPFLKDHIQVLPQPSNFHGRQYDTDTLDGTSVSGDMDPATKLAHLEKSIDFLKRHHREVLESLHEEIENLKTENKELQFKAIMAREDTPKKESTQSSIESQKSSKARSKMSSPSQAQKFDQLKSMFLEEKVKELTATLQDSRNGNAFLQQRLTETLEKRPISFETGQQTSPSVDSSRDHLVPVSVHPLKVQRPNDSHPRQPTMEECELIIMRLHESNESLQHDWTPDAYLLAKAYVASDAPQEIKGKLPRVALQNQSKKLPATAFIKDTISLPPLTQTMGNKAVDRQKRVHAIKRARQQRKEVFL
ncbi:hypothetical protein BSL78_02501 [Apostichopus japonicus]|uniref:Coiled-coil domain-containing protein n=1 Tax=Stichopus japonicus TaxID=307972 RepID=A0A2G8LK08_STIJA|nr:hypothetical protein BSL78_02501 [Apostichopus japonicus]